MVIRRAVVPGYKSAAELEKQYRKHGASPWLNQTLVQKLAERCSTSIEVTGLRLRYEYTLDKGCDRRTSATGRRFCRMRYKALLKEFAEEK